MSIDRSKACDRMFGVLLSMPEESRHNRSDICEALYDAGYRKFEIVDEPIAPADGGPAFGELKQAGNLDIKQGGLTTRDYFAVHANADEVTALQRRTDENLDDFQARYRYADQMLKERAK